MSIESPFDCLKYFLLPGNAAVFHLKYHKDIKVFCRALVSKGLSIRNNLVARGPP